MHILEIPSFFTPYGGEFCLDQAKALKALGHEVRILSNVQLGMTIGMKDYLLLPYRCYEHEVDGLSVLQHFQRGIPKVVRPNVRRWVAMVEAMFQSYVARYGKPDIIHAHCAKWAGYAAMKISQALDVPYVITEHLSLMSLESEFGKAPGKAWQIPYLKQAYEQAAVVLTVSEELVHDTACYYGTDYRWQYVSNVIDTQFFQFAQRKPCDGRRFRFCCVADYSFRKGYDVLFEACQLLQTNGVDIDLHIAGRMTDGKDCQTDIARNGLTHIFTHGLLDREGVRSLLYESDALVLTSRSEVQPLVVLEAMSTGIPVVGTTSIPRCLRIEGGCRVVAVDDAAALAAAMQALSKEPILNGEHLSEQVRAMASPEIVGKQLQAIFDEVLASR